MRYLKISFLFLMFVIALQSAGQMQISEININKISHQKVRDYLQNQQSNQVGNILDIKPSLLPDSDHSGFKIDERIYVVKGSLDKVWQHYVRTNPGDSWNGKKVSFGLLLSKKQKKVVYEGESVSRIDTGQVVYLNLRIMNGLANLVTVFEFTSVDEKNKTLEFSYINGNITLGTQNLRFIETTKGYTEIIHTTHFKSNSAVRDRVYPFFHARIINDFHRNMKKLYLAKDINSVELNTLTVDSEIKEISVDNSQIVASE
jgi:hypothetical protein